MSFDDLGPRRPLKPMREEARIEALRVNGLDKDMLPFYLNQSEADAAQNPGVFMEPEVSPTGTPVAPSLTGSFGKILAGLVGLAALLLPIIPAHTWVGKALAAIVGLGGAVGILSAGARK